MYPKNELQGMLTKLVSLGLVRMVEVDGQWSYTVTEEGVKRYEQGSGSLNLLGEDA